MKPSTKIIIYDDTCPLCAAYTNAFVKGGFIEKQNRKNFSTISTAILALIDKEKSKNEIPVIDTISKKVYYGIDGLVEILSAKLPFIKTLTNIKPLKWFLLKLYKFISYNRRVIVAKEATNANFDCTPQFNLKYRFVFALVFLLFNTAMLFPIQKYIIDKSIFNSNILQLQIAHFLLVACNLLIATRLPKFTSIEYIGQVNMLATIVVMLLLPLALVNKIFVEIPTVVNSIYLFAITIFIINEYIRRMKFAAIYKYYPWVAWVNVFCIFSFIAYLLL